MFTVNNKGTRTVPLASLILNIVNIDIVNIEQLSLLILVPKLLTLNWYFLARKNDITNKNSQNKIFSSFNFAFTKICVAISLAEDGTRMGGI